MGTQISRFTAMLRCHLSGCCRQGLGVAAEIGVPRAQLPWPGHVTGLVIQSTQESKQGLLPKHPESMSQ